MNFLVQVTVLIVLTGLGSVPPHAPNFCGQNFCLELQPMLHSERRGFVQIEKSLVEMEGRSWMKFNYGDLGTISVIGPVPTSSVSTQVGYDEKAEEITVDACVSNEGSGECDRYLISIVDNGVAKKPLVCSVVSFWTARPEDNSPEVRLGPRVDIGEQLAQRCL